MKSMKTMTTPNALTQPRRYAVIGNPVQHSRSPWIHAQFAAQTGIFLDYTRLETADFDATATTFFRAGGSGANVTVPFKTQAYALAQEHSARARAAQAVNTLWMEGGTLHGCNTDGVGLVRDITQQGAVLQGARVLLVGAGGAARGALFALIESGCAQLRIVNRTAENARKLAAYAAAYAADYAVAYTATDARNPLSISLPACAGRIDGGGLGDAAGVAWDIVVNATSSSLHDQAPALPEGIYAANAMAYDMMYGAEPTAFLRAARTQGAAHCADGLGMLVHQAAESFRIWHGVQPNPAPVLAGLRAVLARENSRKG